MVPSHIEKSERIRQSLNSQEIASEVHIYPQTHANEGGAALTTCCNSKYIFYNLYLKFLSLWNKAFLLCQHPVGKVCVRWTVAVVVHC